MTIDQRNKYILETISIENFMGFKDAKMEFPQPKGKKGSGLTIITGPNNSGKTSLLQAITSTSASQAFEEMYSEGFKIIKTINKEKYEITLNNNSLVGNTYTPVYFSSIESTRYWENNSGHTRDPLSNNTNHMQRNPNYRVSDGLFEISKNKDSYEALTNKLKKVIPDIKNWSGVCSKRGNYLQYEDINGNKHSTDFLGSGVISLFRICSQLSDLTATEKRHNILIIDEPELSLHPTLQKKLAELLLEESKDRQIIISTHSSYFVNSEALQNGAKLVRVNKDEEGCKLYVVDHEILIKEFGKYNQPYLFDIVAKEIFFADKILILEGQEDVGLLRKWLRIDYKGKDNYNPQFEIFGYGSGGVDNIPKFLELFSKLGIKKVGILTDKLLDKKHIDTKNNIKKKVEEYKYHFQELGTNDIRDKVNIINKKLLDMIEHKEGMVKFKAGTSIEAFNDCIELKTQGYFNDKGEIKKCKSCEDYKECKDEACKHGSLVKIFDEFHKYFN
jgi:predicted ATP-dependent endonuclease of OLD family